MSIFMCINTYNTFFLKRREILTISKDFGNKQEINQLFSQCFLIQNKWTKMCPLYSQNVLFFIEYAGVINKFMKE
ncbi:unnamed protein product [Heterobilharzia americana]|nr:unnamed protein product [Heterobilharzia americana]